MLATQFRAPGNLVRCTCFRYLSISVAKCSLWQWVYPTTTHFSSFGRSVYNRNCFEGEHQNGSTEYAVLLHKVVSKYKMCFEHFVCMIICWCWQLLFHELHFLYSSMRLGMGRLWWLLCNMWWWNSVQISCNHNTGTTWWRLPIKCGQWGSRDKTM